MMHVHGETQAGIIRGIHLESLHGEIKTPPGWAPDPRFLRFEFIDGGFRVAAGSCTLCAVGRHGPCANARGGRCCCLAA